MTLRHVSLLLGLELRHRARAVRRDDQKLGLVLLGVPIGALVTAFLARTAFSAGRGGLGADAALALVETALAGIVAVSAFLVGLRALQNLAAPLAPAAVLPAARHGDVVAAHLLLEALFAFLLLGLPGAVVGAAYALGAGAPATAPLVAVSVAAAVLLGTGVGFAGGYLVRLVAARSALIARYRDAVAAACLFAFLIGFTVTDPDWVLVIVLVGLRATPLGSLDDLALLGAVQTADPLGALFALLSTVAAVAAFWWANSRLAAKLWYTAPVRPSVPTRSERSVRLPLASSATNHVATKTWKRARRVPLKLLYVGYGIGLVAIVLTNTLRDGSVPAVTVLFVAVYGAWATGAAFTLNPLGEEWPVLPMTTTAPVEGRRLVAGLWLASVIPGVPLTTIAAVAVATASPFEPAGLALVGTAAASLAALAPGIAAGIGVAFPRTERVDLFRSRQTIVPSAAAFYGYSIALGLCTLPVWAVTPAASSDLAATAGVGPSAVAWAALALAVALTGAAALVGFRFAARRIDAFTLS